MAQGCASISQLPKPSKYEEIITLFSSMKFPEKDFSDGMDTASLIRHQSAIVEVLPIN